MIIGTVLLAPSRVTIACDNNRDGSSDTFPYRSQKQKYRQEIFKKAPTGCGQCQINETPSGVSFL